MKRAIALALLCLYAQSKVVSIVELAVPGSTIPWEILKEDKWTRFGRNLLTDSGRRASYIAGYDLRNRYPDLFGDTKGFTAKSIDYSFAQEGGILGSGQAHLLAVVDQFSDTQKLVFANDDYRMFPPSPITFNTSEIDFNTALPHNHRPQEFNSILKTPSLRLDNTRCPFAGERQKSAISAFNTKIANDEGLNRVIKQTIADASKAYGKDSDAMFAGKSDLKTCQILADYAIQEYLNINEAAFSSSSQTFTSLKNCYSLYQHSLFADSGYLQSYVTPFLSLLSTQVTNSFQPNSPTKLTLFVERHELLLAVLTSAGVVSKDCVMSDLREMKDSVDCFKNWQQVSAIIWELHQESDGSQVVKTVLNGNPIHFCSDKDRTADKGCPVAQFQSRIKELTNPSLDSWCQQGVKPAPTPEKQTDNEKAYNFWKMFTFAMILLILIMGVVMWFAISALFNNKSALEENLVEKANTVKVTGNESANAAL